LKKTFWQFFKFGLVGLTNTAVSLAVYYLCIWIRSDTMMALIGQTGGWIAGIANSFWWNRRFVFKESSEVWWRALIKMYIGYGFTLLLSLLLTYIQVEWLGISTMTAPLLNLIVTIPINFLISKYWSFQKGGSLK
jgi:putative flippase GtrA